MAIKYYKLLDLLNRKGMTKEQLRQKANLGSATMTKISKNESVTINTIDAICEVLQCQPGEILEWVSTKNERNSSENS